MTKYIVTLLVDGQEYPITIRATDSKQAEKKLFSMIHIAKPIRIETKDEYKKRTKPFQQVMKSSFISIKSSKELTID